MRIYVATTVPRFKDCRIVQEVLRKSGHTITHDWTKDIENIDDIKHTAESLQEAALQDVEGVRAANLLVVLLPAARGTHIEIGAAIALRKPVILATLPGAEDFKVSSDACCFYWYHSIIRIQTKDHSVFKMGHTIAQVIEDSFLYSESRK